MKIRRLNQALLLANLDHGDCLYLPNDDVDDENRDYYIKIAPISFRQGDRHL